MTSRGILLQPGFDFPSDGGDVIRVRLISRGEVDMARWVGAAFGAAVAAVEHAASGGGEEV